MGQKGGLIRDACGHLTIAMRFRHRLSSRCSSRPDDSVGGPLTREQRRWLLTNFGSSSMVLSGMYEVTAMAAGTREYRAPELLEDPYNERRKQIVGSFSKTTNIRAFSCMLYVLATTGRHYASPTMQRPSSTCMA
jgi:serine/threonine protein kinase